MCSRIVSRIVGTMALLTLAVVALASPPADLRGMNGTMSGSIRLGGLVLGTDQNLSLDFPVKDSGKVIWSILFNVSADPNFPADLTHIQIKTEVPAAPTLCNLDGRINLTLTGTYDPTTGKLVASGSKPGILNLDTGIVDGPGALNVHPGEEIWIQLKDAAITLHGTADVVGGKTVITGADAKANGGGPSTNMILGSPLYVAWAKVGDCPAANAPAIPGNFTLEIKVSSPYGGFRWNAISNSIAGKIALDSITDLSTIVTPLQPFQFDLRPVGGGSTISMTASLASDGSYLLTDMPLDIYNVAIKGSKWLRVVVPKISIATSVPVAGTAVGVDASLLGGDADGNNVVGLDDLGILALAFDTKPGDDLWDESADFNCDGVVGLDDLGLLANNFDIAGDP